MNNIILIRKDKPSFQIQIIAYFTEILGIILIIGSEWMWWKILIGVILLILGLMVITLKSEQYYNYDNNSLILKWRNIFFNKNQTEKLPEIDHLAIIRVKTTKNLNYKSITVQESGFMCNLNLIYKESEKRYRKLCTLEKEEAFRLAKELSEKINKPILDNSTPDKKWIKK